ncbi:hypothetical protein ACFW5U_36305 [Streptomyces rochei]|uniref:hypothetical protein n=1 Tax=Streptomyces rochei TaxID=1928 RepID=UPI0036BBF1FF
MSRDLNALRDAADRVGLPFDYLQRLAQAEAPDPQDPEGTGTLAKQLTIVFDHYMAKCLANSDPVTALRDFGFEESAETLAKAR